MRQPQPVLAPTWQYALFWTPGRKSSLGELWAISSSGTQTLWDSFDLEPQLEVPSLHRVWHSLYVAVLQGQERSTGS